MCVVKSPKVTQPTTTENVPVLRNPYLDGINPSIQSLMIGRSALTIDPQAPSGGASAGTTIPAAAGGSGATAPVAAPAVPTLQQLQLSPSTSSVSIGGTRSVSPKVAALRASIS